MTNLSLRRAICGFLISAASLAPTMARAAAQVGSTLSHTLRQAQLVAGETGQRGVALLLLPQHDGSQLSQRTEAIEVHDPAVRFAMHAYGLVVLQPSGPGVYRLAAVRQSCEGVSACAEDAFLDCAFTLRGLRTLDPAAGKLPLLLVFDTDHARPIGTAYGVDDRSQALRFAAGLRTAGPQRPLTAYADELLDD